MAELTLRSSRQGQLKPLGKKTLLTGLNNFPSSLIHSLKCLGGLFTEGTSGSFWLLLAYATCLISLLDCFGRQSFNRGGGGELHSIQGSYALKKFIHGHPGVSNEVS